MNIFIVENMVVCLCLMGMLFLAGCSSGSSVSSVEIIAHRGASGSAPENTLSSAVLAWKKGADAVEIDVHLTKDNRVVVIHDGSTKRTTGVDLQVRETPSEELRKLDAGAFKGQEFVGERIPFLEEIIATIPPRRRLFVEVKCGKEILPVLDQIITQNGKASQIVVIGFDLETMAMSKTLMPHIPTYWLLNCAIDEQTKKPLPHDMKLIQTAREKGLDGLDVHSAGLTRDFADAVEAAGLELYVWTIYSSEHLRSLQGLKIDGITVDDPAAAREWLGELDVCPN